ncbi:MAG TPA: hypothetical protein VFU94_14780 [Conexibacter sp.]|nr:hypothetical protein [Conexibacter sp.]
MPDTIELARSDFASLFNAMTGRRSLWVSAADTAIVRALEHQALADAFGEHERKAARENAESSLAELVDEICGTPPHIPRWWPPRHDESPTEEFELASHELLAVGARFQGAADAFAGHVLAPLFADCADKLVEEGLARMEGIPRPEPA